MLKVTNNNFFDLKDRYDGRDYVFPANKTVRCPEEAAKHIFGLGAVDKMPYLARQGWVRTANDLQEGMAILNQFAFMAVQEDLADDMALVEHRPSTAMQAEAGDEPGTDGSGDSPAEASPKVGRGGKKGRGHQMERPRSIIERLTPA